MLMLTLLSMIFRTSRQKFCQQFKRNWGNSVICRCTSGAHLGHTSGKNLGTPGAHLGHISGKKHTSGTPRAKPPGAHLGHISGTSRAKFGHGNWETLGKEPGHTWGTSRAKSTPRAKPPGARSFRQYELYSWAANRSIFMNRFNLYYLFLR